MMKVDPDIVIPNKELSILDGRHQGQRLEQHPWGRHHARMYFDALSKKYQLLGWTRR